MNIYLTAECEAPACRYLSDLWSDFKPRLAILNSRKYGDDLEDIGIITVCLGDEFDIGWRESLYYSKRKRDASVRMKLPFKEFTRAKPCVRRVMYINHIVTAVERLRPRLHADFQMDLLVKDINQLLLNDVAE